MLTIKYYDAYRQEFLPEKNVNAQLAKSIGDRVADKMNGKTLSEFIPRIAYKVVLISSNSSGKEDKNRLVYPVLMFQRIVSVAKRSEKKSSSTLSMNCVHT